MYTSEVIDDESNIESMPILLGINIIINYRPSIYPSPIPLRTLYVLHTPALPIGIQKFVGFFRT